MWDPVVDKNKLTCMYELPAYPEPRAETGNKSLDCGYGFQVVICSKETIDDMKTWIAQYSDRQDVVEGDFQAPSPFMHRTVKKHRLFQSSPLLLIPHLPLGAYGHIPASIMPQTYEWRKQKYLRLSTECVALLVDYCTAKAETDGLRQLKDYLREGNYELSQVHVLLISTVSNILLERVRNINVKAFIGSRYLMTYVHAFVMWYVNDFKRGAAVALKKEAGLDTTQLPGLLTPIALMSMGRALSRWPLDNARQIEPVHTMHHYRAKTIKARPVPPFKISVHSVLEGDRVYDTYQRTEALQDNPRPLIAFVQNGIPYDVFQDRYYSFKRDEESGVLRIDRQHKRGPVTKYVYSLDQKSMMENDDFLGNFLYVTDGAYHVFIKLI